MWSLYRIILVLRQENLALKNWCFWSVLFQKTLESSLNCKEIQPVHPKGNQSWIFDGRISDVAEIPILWPPDVKSWLFGKDSDAGKDWRQGEKGMTEYDMVGWHHKLDGHELEQALGVAEGQRSLACCSPWGCKESDVTEQLNWTEAREKGFWHFHWPLSAFLPAVGRVGRKGHGAGNSGEAAPISQEKSSKEFYRSKFLAAGPVASSKKNPQESG